MTITGDNSYETELQVNSKNHGTFFDSTIYGSVNQNNLTKKISLNYNDEYTITISKHPFHSTVTIRGTINLYTKEITTAVINPSPTILELSQYAIVPIFLAVTMFTLFSLKRKKGNSRSDLVNR